MTAKDKIHEMYIHACKDYYSELVDTMYDSENFKLFPTIETMLSLDRKYNKIWIYRDILIKVYDMNVDKLQKEQFAIDDEYYNRLKEMKHD